MNNQNHKKPWKNDIAVLCIFFARPDILAKSFASVREARPRQLLLWQDGPREGRSDDIENIEKCRKIVEDIDWECEVFTNYHDKNMGCDPSTHYAHKWAFTIVDKCIILEDDIVPSQSFYPFCKELLDKYENDPRVDRICGMNLLLEYDNDGADYFFSQYGSSWGWATWKRVADSWDTDYCFLQYKRVIQNLKDRESSEKQKETIIKRLIKEKQSGIPYWEMVTGVRTLLYNGLVIYPTKNLIQNVGLSSNSTHAPKSIDSINNKTRHYFFSNIYEYSFPLKHPRYIFDDINYRNECSKRFRQSFWEKVLGKARRFLNH